MDVLLLLYPFARVLGWHGLGDYMMDPDGHLTRRPENNVAPYAYMGVSILHPRAGVVFRRDQLDVVFLATVLVGDGLGEFGVVTFDAGIAREDRKSTRLNSSH